MMPVESPPARPIESVRVWDAASGRELQRLSDHASALVGVAILPDNKSIVSAGADNCRSRVDSGRRAGLRWSSGTDLQRGRPSRTEPMSSRPRPTSRSRSSTSRPATLVRTLAGHTGAVKAVAVTQGRDQGHLGLGRQDVPGLERGRRQAALDAADRLPRAVTSVAAASNNALAAAGLADGTVKVFDLTTADSAKAERRASRARAPP